MSLPYRMRVWGWLIRDTFRQAFASYLFALMFGVSTLCILVCLSVTTEGVATIHRPGEQSEFLPRSEVADAKEAKLHGVDLVRGELRIAFGAMSVPIGRDTYDAIRFVQLVLAGLVADTAGVLLALVWTAGFLPTFLDRRSVSVLLAKPAGRTDLLLGKYVGVLVFVFSQATFFVVGTWFALGIRTGVWAPDYLLSIPLLLLHFAIFFSFSMLLAVCTRSTVVCVIGSLFFWAACWGLNYGRHLIVAQELTSPENVYSPALRGLANAIYWIVPKPMDFSAILFNTLDASRFFQTSMIATLQEHGAFYVGPSVFTSTLYAVFLVGAAIQQFRSADY